MKTIFANLVALFFRLIKIILTMLPWKSRRILLAASTKRTGKTALHLAAATGQPCQMQALMDFGMHFIHLNLLQTDIDK